jgi:hypothetical protein
MVSTTGDLHRKKTFATHHSLSPLRNFLDFKDPLITKGLGDSTLATNRKHHLIMGGIGFLLAGRAICYRSRLQPTAKFCYMTDEGKGALYLRCIFDQIGIKHILMASYIDVSKYGLQ